VKTITNEDLERWARGGYGETRPHVSELARALLATRARLERAEAENVREREAMSRAYAVLTGTEYGGAWNPDDLVPAAERVVAERDEWVSKFDRESEALVKAKRDLTKLYAVAEALDVAWENFSEQGGTRERNALAAARAAYHDMVARADRAKRIATPPAPVSGDEERARAWLRTTYPHLYCTELDEDGKDLAEATAALAREFAAVRAEARRDALER
jgi:hypothetical protein